MKMLSAPEDLQWLRDVHLKDCVTPPFAVAIIDGNEDWPKSITLLEQDHINSIALVLVPDEDGVFHCNQTRY